MKPYDLKCLSHVFNCASMLKRRCKNESKWLCGKNTQCLHFFTTVSATEECVVESSHKKLLKVAILGRPNAGKSTLINKLMNLNICGVSHKCHTTRAPLKAAFTQGDTQIVFIDTPGLVTSKEQFRFNLSNNFSHMWEKHYIKTADVIGVVHDIIQPQDIFRFHLNLSQTVKSLPENKELFLVINKIDLVLDKEELSKAMESVKDPENEKNKYRKTLPKIFKKFSKIFFTSTLKDIGVQDLFDYLIERAKPGEWIFNKNTVCDESVERIILEQVRAHLMDVLPHEVPYQCKYQIEYLKENDLGELICVSQVKCKPKHYQLITMRRKKHLRTLCKEIESDLFKILRKVCRIRIVVTQQK